VQKTPKSSFLFLQKGEIQELFLFKVFLKSCQENEEKLNKTDVTLQLVRYALRTNYVQQQNHYF